MTELEFGCDRCTRLLRLLEQVEPLLTTHHRSCASHRGLECDCPLLRVRNDVREELERQP